MLFYVGFPWNSDQIESDCVNLHLFPSEIQWYENTRTGFRFWNVQCSTKWNISLWSGLLRSFFFNSIKKIIIFNFYLERNNDQMWLEDITIKILFFLFTEMYNYLPTMQWILILFLTSDSVSRKVLPISFDPASYFTVDNESNRRYWLAGQLSCHCRHLMCHGEQLNCQKSLKDSLRAWYCSIKVFHM